MTASPRTYAALAASKAPSIADGRIPCCVYIGVTGHRDVTEHQALRARVRERLVEVCCAFPSSATTPIHIVVLSALAEGADRLVVQEVFGALPPRARSCTRCYQWLLMSTPRISTPRPHAMTSMTCWEAPRFARSCQVMRLARRHTSRRAGSLSTAATSSLRFGTAARARAVEEQPPPSNMRESAESLYSWLRADGPAVRTRSPGRSPLAARRCACGHPEGVCTNHGAQQETDRGSPAGEKNWHAKRHA